MLRFFGGILVWCLILWTADGLFGIDPTFGEMLAVMLATTGMLLVNETL